ncbi:hypothetical protein B0T25DRAFT_574148 [Lasiosphaeria hispida]|uniref:Uncharacterized protein n=1 Tax=Lasiosphaeria hispida TaxID=260671 RepID=A0AAJ0M8N1_9PEZI|nr:hypothetical protein B0T25DRAFT_574148 [Lasiosphaeria hispida]
MSTEPRRLVPALSPRPKKQRETGDQAITVPPLKPKPMPFMSGSHAFAEGKKPFRKGHSVFVGGNRAFAKDIQAIAGSGQANRPGGVTPAMSADVDIKLEPGEIVKDAPTPGSIALAPRQRATPAFQPYRPLSLGPGVPPARGIPTGPRHGPQGRAPLGQPVETMRQPPKNDATYHPMMPNSPYESKKTSTAVLAHYTQSQRPSYTPKWEIVRTRDGMFTAHVYLQDEKICGVGSFVWEKEAKYSTAAQVLVKLGVWPPNRSTAGNLLPRPTSSKPKRSAEIHDNNSRLAHQQSGGAYGRMANSIGQASPPIKQEDHHHARVDAAVGQPNLIEASDKKRFELLEQLQKIMGPAMGRDRSQDSPAAVAAFLEGMAVGARVAQFGGQPSSLGSAEGVGQGPPKRHEPRSEQDHEDHKDHETRGRRRTRSRSPRRGDHPSSRRHRARSTRRHRNRSSSRSYLTSSPAQNLHAAAPRDHYSPRRNHPFASSDHYSPLRVKHGQPPAGGHRAPYRPQSHPATGVAGLGSSEHSYPGMKMTAADEEEMWLANEAAGYGSGPLNKRRRRSTALRGINGPSFAQTITEEWPHDLFMQRERELDRS